MMAFSARIKELKTAIAAGLGRLSSPSPSLVIAFCSPGIVHHLDRSALAYLVGINQLARHDQPETVVDQALHTHEPGAPARRELDQGASKGRRRAVAGSCFTACCWACCSLASLPS